MKLQNIEFFLIKKESGVGQQRKEWFGIAIENYHGMQVEANAPRVF